MKNLILLLILFVSTFVGAQTFTPFYTLSSSLDGEAVYDGKAAASGISFYNSYVGGDVLYNFQGEDIEIAGDLLYIAAFGDRWAFPITGNVKVGQLDSLKSGGGKIGLAPYYILSSNGGFALVAFSSIDYKIAEKGGINQFGFLTGLEAIIKPFDNGNAISLAVAPEFKMNAGDSGDQQWGLGITNILPIDDMFGFLSYGFLPFRSGTKASFSLGVAVRGPIGK